jgi:arabinofuranosyltransferase
VLWPLLVAVPYSMGIDIYWAAMGTSLLCSLGAVALLLRRALGQRAVYAACAGVLCLTLSSAYVDYSTSGLDNPLAHLLLVIFFSSVLARRDGEHVGVAPFFLAALISLNRQDHLLLVLPALLSLLFQARPARAGLRRALIGLAPLALGLAFATFYYGFPFPNTAYAKLTTDIPSQTLAAQGVWYAMTTMQRDPLTLGAIALAIGLALRERSRASLIVGLGLMLYVAYVVRIGGDFMAGRFFTAPLIVAIVWLSTGPFARSASGELLVVVAIAGGLGLWMAAHMEPVEKLACNVPQSGIANERHCYFEHNALTQNLRDFKYQSHPYYQVGSKLRANGTRVTASMPGMAGFAAGPKVHIIDGYALTDPLLARMPYRPEGHWRIGHFPRVVPAGYAESLETGRNLIVDPCLHRYYDALSTVIRGPLWSTARFVEIFKLNTGAYDFLLRKDCKPR